MSKRNFECFEPCHRVKLIGVLPDDKYFCSLSRFGDFYSLIGGSLDDNVFDPEDNLILSNIEREFYEESFGSLFLSFMDNTVRSAFDEKKFKVQFRLAGIIRDLDTFFVIIFFENVRDVQIIIEEARIGRHKILCEIYGKDIDDEIAMNVIDDILQYRRFTMNLVHYSKFEIQRLKRESLKRYHYLEKRNMEILEGCNFFDKDILWEWKKHNPESIRQKIFQVSI